MLSARSTSMPSRSGNRRGGVARLRLPASPWSIPTCAFLLVLALGPCSWAAQPKPLLVIYCPSTPNYGQELARLIRQDGRMEAEIQTVESLDIFKTMLYLPNVKVAIVTLPISNKQSGLDSALEWFFSQGGGLVGIGFAGSESATGNASQTVFPIFGTGYRPGTLDPKTRKFNMSHAKEEDDEISNGIQDFTVPDHKLVLSFNPANNTYAPKSPAVGEYKVLFREKGSGAPSIVKYRNKGVSVTFASFGADDFPTGYNYFRRFTNTTEFRTLFTNAVSWVWNAESKYDASMAKAAEYYGESRRDLDRVKEEAQRIQRRSKDAKLFRTIITLVVAGAACIAVYYVTFVKAPKPGQTA